jgi:hypothetical protein
MRFCLIIRRIRRRDRMVTPQHQLEPAERRMRKTSPAPQFYAGRRGVDGALKVG